MCLLAENVRSILVADDHDGLREAIGDALTSAGYFVIQAGNGAEVFAVLCCGVPDLLLLDLSMPFVDGRQVMGALRVHHPLLPVLLITAASDAGRIVDELGADGYLLKPFRADALLQTVAGMLGPSQLANV
jgi:CheY-like chemotaxis protein